MIVGIDRINSQRDASMGQMDADLMGAAGDRLNRQQSKPPKIHNLASM